MEGFTYVDIFATKGIEYIFVICFLLLFVVFAYSTFKPKHKTLTQKRSIGDLIRQWFLVPEFLYYHQGHTWVLPESEKVAKIGLDDFAQKLVGRIEALKIPKMGEEIVQGEKALRIEVGGKGIEMLAPLDGEVIDVNEEVLKDPSRLMEDPYGEGWLLRVYSPNLRSNLRNLLTGRLARRWMDVVKENLFSRMDYNLGLVLQDGGIPVSGMAKSLDPENWDEIVKEFFLTKGA
jgi:glycine cleavage system H protein